MLPVLTGMTFKGIRFDSEKAVRLTEETKEKEKR